MKVPTMNPARVYRRERAFTLVELLVSMGILGILATIAASTFRVTLDTREKAVRKMQLAENARTTLDFMAEELRTAYLTPESVAPVLEGQQDAPPLRFVGIHRNRPVVPKPSTVSDTSQWTPGAGEDEDGDDKTDEEWLDALDNDFSPTAVNKPWSYEPNRTDGSVDEDIGMFPSDILHFVTAQRGTVGGPTVLTEVSYGLNSIGTRLIRRAHKADEEKEILHAGKFFVDPGQTQGRRFLPPPLPTKKANGGVIPNSGYQAMLVGMIGGTWDEFADDVLDGGTNDRQISEFEILAYDIRGLRLRYWYYDYNEGAWRVTQEWDSARETLLFNQNIRIFDGTIPGLAADIATNDLSRYRFPISNEPSDALPRDTLGIILNELRPSGVRQGTGNLLSDPAYSGLVKRINSTTDGLPWVVEIEIYVQDQDRAIAPQRFSTRVFIPNNNVPPPPTTGGVTS